MEERAYTVPQLKQMDAVAIRASKATAKTHFFHTDTSTSMLPICHLANHISQ